MQPDTRFRKLLSRLTGPALAFGAGLLLAACASTELTRSGMLASYDGLQRSDGMLTRSAFRVDRASLVAAKTIHLEPARVAPWIGGGKLDPGQLALVGNALDRTLCARLSERFRIAAPGQPADFAVQTFVTAVTPTDTTIAGVSAVVGLGGAAASAATGLPLQVPRLPFGLGAMAVEAQAVGDGKRQVAAFAWARGADSLTKRARASEEADAYLLAGEFAEDFARLLITGEDPIQPSAATLPTLQSVAEFWGARPMDAACERFGRNPGLVGFVGGVFGAPPRSTDESAAAE
jgi:hypothetical protein